MARNRSIIDDLVLLPWWVNLILAGFTYILLKYILPEIESDNPIFKGVFMTLSNFSGLFSSLLCFIALFSAVRAWQRGELFKQQTSLNSIKDLSWQQFEQYIGEVYRRKGYTVEETGLDGADGGVDLVLSKDGENLLVQCKNWKTKKVGVSIVRELFGVVKARNASGGIIVTAGSYTQDAQSFAEDTGIELIDGIRLTQLINSIRDNPLQEKTPTQQSSSSPLCPKCNSPMVMRTAKKGVNAGNSFWGCSRFPACRGVRKND